SFSVLTLVLGGILVATMIASLMARQMREIGVMKTVGAGSGQIAALYLSMILGFGMLALAVGIPPGVLAARRFATVIGGLLNFTIGSGAIPGWVFAVQVGAGLLIPLAMAGVPLWRGSRMGVRRALDDQGVRAERFGARRGDGWLTRLRGVDRALVLALRNTFRRRGRLALTLGLLAAGGAMFMTARNVTEGWAAVLGRVDRTRHYDVEIRFARPEATAPLLARVRAMPGIRAAEAWGYAPTSVAAAGVEMVRTYPDGGHGSFLLQGAPVRTRLVGFPLLAGRWLAEGDGDGVVLNQMALSQLPGARVGSRVALSLDGRATRWRVVGIVEEVGSPAAAYVTDRAFARAAGLDGRARMLRIATSATDPATREVLVRRVETELEGMGARVSVAIPVSVLRTAMGAHMGVLVDTLLAIAVLMALVGGLGLMSTMSMNVLERTREIGVMQAVGATPAAVLRVIVGEGVFTGLMSWVVAVILSLPLSAMLGRMVGQMAFRTPLPLVVSPAALAGSLLAVVATSAAASGWPAWRASRLTVRESLAYG
ncbi:MAG TPA: FtsX-like permease family protein, partial [Longimicrobiaceae bacterium]|nr:FtsX-like permease family protein [Longimicrobiaceae bacterium]